MNRATLVCMLTAITLISIGCGGGGGGHMISNPPPAASDTPFWAQWGSNPQHSGNVSVAGQSLTNKHADIIYDPFIDQEKAENQPVFGEAVLTVHEQAPITDGNDVYMVTKSGTYNSCNPVGDWVNGTACGPNTWNTMVWNETRYTWENGQLTQIWQFASDWKPEPNASNLNGGISGLVGWEPVFHPLDANNFIYVPGAAGTLWKVDKNKGTSASQINPFSAVSSVSASNTFVASPLTADSSGNIFYNVVEFNTTNNPWTNDIAGAWLVKVTSGDTASIVAYSALTPTAPAGISTNCPGTFFNLGDGGTSLPWPPTANDVPLTQRCGSQRAPLNLAPAIGPDGIIYTASMASFDPQVSFIIAVNPDLSLKWSSSMQNLLSDGCGVLVAIAAQGVTTTPNTCRFGTTTGVDPTTNAPGSAVLSDLASSSPTVLPDGSIVLGVLDNYNFARGHLMHFSAQGVFLNAYTFGWDSTPGVYPHGSTYSIVIKDNHYDAASYCSFPNNPVCTSRQPGPYYISQIDPNMNVEWSFQSTTIDTNHPNGYEWCINMPAIDMNGNVFVNSEDGNIYELPQGNTGIFTTPGGKMFLNLALGAAYTPLSVGSDGSLYTQNNGHMFVVGN
jgi:hypothetical protein